MATISSIVPDADGDLHDASLHNQKFNTILNEINGNIDAENTRMPCRRGVSVARFWMMRS